MPPKPKVWVRRWITTVSGYVSEWVIADRKIDEPVDAVGEEHAAEKIQDKRIGVDFFTIWILCLYAH